MEWTQLQRLLVFPTPFSFVLENLSPTCVPVAIFDNTDEPNAANADRLLLD